VRTGAADPSADGTALDVGAPPPAGTAAWAFVDTDAVSALSVPAPAQDAVRAASTATVIVVRVRMVS
jgi:hypothetical protein